MDFVRACLVLGAAALTACGGGGGGGGGSGGDRASGGAPSVAAAIQYNAAPVNVCPNGGARLDTGIDANNNGLLDAGEVTTTQYVCNGANGGNGLTTLVSITDEAAGANCANGGKKISAGLDANNSTILESGEGTSTGYLCNGATGANGTNGTTGATGATGLTSLIALSVESAGANCPTGGTKVESGIDVSRNGGLESTEVTATSYVCTGPKGPGVTWVEATADVQAKPNIGYLANSPSGFVRVTLPTDIAVGDVVRVSGVGPGTWYLSQNAGQSIPTPGLVSGIGVAWTPRATAASWAAVASDASGQLLMAAVKGGQIYTSSNSGVTWQAESAPGNGSWQAVAYSASSGRAVAVEYGGRMMKYQPYTWSTTAFTANWQSVAMSADGNRLVAVVDGGQIYTSPDFGLTWYPRETARAWKAVASSADGMKLVAVVKGGLIYISKDGGVTWTARDSARQWQSVASSADGNRLIAAESSGYIYASTDGGTNWIVQGPWGFWQSVASSADGTRLFATDGTQIHTSIDSGMTWTGGGFALAAWNSIAASANGTKLAASSGGGQIYTSTPGTSTGTFGGISGRQFEAVEVQYAGNNTFIMLSHTGDVGIH